ncbi:acVLRF1 family peptidyl-tRNA hydrolase [Spirillospora sp. CA-294931]|uniref:acVLRF1 family peptidyl-tRNA hydrolase n=1 Tax=Spirillospora sp. CA-294931 TaxID=3240042 RepID=UPI003D8D14E2
MSKPRPAAGGGHWVEVPPERVARWLENFAGRHGAVTTVTRDAEVVTYTAGDGAVADFHVPFPPLTGDDLIAHVRLDRRVGVLLVRLGGYAAGVFEGERLVASKVGTRQVHGRSAAGGWSQQRFARRRDKQAREALEAAAGAAARVLAPRVPCLDAVVLGGERRAVDELRADPRLGPVFALALDEPFLTVPDPRLAVLSETPASFRAVRVRIREP